MKHRSLLCVVRLLVRSRAAPGDTVHLANGGKVVGTVVRLTLAIGPLEKVFERGQMRALSCRRSRCEVMATDDTRYIGKVRSVVIRSVAGVLTFGAKSITAVELNDRTRREPDRAGPGPVVRTEPKPDGAPAVELNVEPEPEPGPKQKEQMAAAAALRDGCLKRAEELATEEYAALKARYWDALRAAVEEVHAKRKDLAKYADKIDASAPQVKIDGLGMNMTRTRTVVTSGPAAKALEEVQKTEAKRDLIVAKVKAEKAAIRQRKLLRTRRVTAYHGAVRRSLLKGRAITEDAMKKIFDKAIEVK